MSGWWRRDIGKWSRKAGSATNLPPPRPQPGRPKPCRSCGPHVNWPRTPNSNNNPPGAGHRVVVEGLSSQSVRPLRGLTGEARSRSGVTVAGGPRGLQVQRDEFSDGRHSLGSCCPEDLSARCRLLRESDPRTRGPQSPVQSDTTVIITSSRAAPGSPKVGSRMVRGSGVATGGVVQFLDKVVDVPVAVPHLQFVKVVDDPVVQVVVVSVQLDRFRELIVEFSATDHEGNRGSDSACTTGSRLWISVPQIMEEIVEVIQVARLGADRGVQCHRSWRKSWK